MGGWLDGWGFQMRLRVKMVKAHAEGRVGGALVDDLSLCVVHSPSSRKIARLRDDSYNI